MSERTWILLHSRACMKTLKAFLRQTLPQSHQPPRPCRLLSYACPSPGPETQTMTRDSP